jgi:hypothetical protein
MHQPSFFISIPFFLGKTDFQVKGLKRRELLNKAGVYIIRCAWIENKKEQHLLF